MAFDSPRIAELRRRVQADPSSIAFAQLAEEHRRGGNYEEAVRVCRTGLERHPGYLSARVTLGRALMELGQLDDAEIEFDLVLGTAADNLAAIRGVAEIHQRRGDLQTALGYYQSALALARHDPDLEETVAQISRSLTDARPARDAGLSFEQMKDELQSAADRMAQGVPTAAGETQATEPAAAGDTAATEPAVVDETPATEPASESAAAQVDVEISAAENGVVGGDAPTAATGAAQPAVEEASAVQAEVVRAAMDALTPPESAAAPAPAESAETTTETPALFDFDGLLEALGQPPTTPAPPQVEAWIASSSVAPELLGAPADESAESVESVESPGFEYAKADVPATLNVVTDQPDPGQESADTSVISPDAAAEASDLFAEALGAAVREMTPPAEAPAEAAETTASTEGSALPVGEDGLAPDAAATAVESADASDDAPAVAAADDADLPAEVLAAAAVGADPSADAPASNEAKAGDILDQIEEDLRRLEADVPPAGVGTAVVAAVPSLAPADQAALDELERWLEVLEDARASSVAADPASSSTTRA